MKKGNVLILGHRRRRFSGKRLAVREKDREGMRKKTSLRIGVLLYRGDDTFIGTLRIPWTGGEGI